MIIVMPFLLINAKPTVAEDKADLKEEIIYNILVDRYNNGDQSLNEEVDINDPTAYHGGDLEGIIMNLDTIQEMGFTTIALSPIMENASEGYHGYWIKDFYNVEKQFGTMEDVQILVEEAHKRDMKVVLEFVTNYISASHDIASDPSKTDWIKENDLKATDSTKWLENVAVLNQDNPEVADYLTDVAEFWMAETNIDGFKLHAADQASANFLKSFTASIKAIDPDFYILANVLQDESRIEELSEIPDIDAVDNQLLLEEMNDVFAEADNPVSPLYELWEDNQLGGLLAVDNKNTKRFSQMVAENGRNEFTSWKLALTYMYMTPGIPSIYQGSEIPMYGGGFPENQMLMQFNSGDEDIPEFLGRIAALRSEFPAFVYGDFEEVGSSGAMSVFKRTYEDNTIYIAINNDSESQTVAVTDVDSGMQLNGLLGDNIVRETKDGEFKIGIGRETAEVYIVEDDKGINWVFIGFILGIFFLFIFAVIYLSRKQKKRTDS